MILQARKVVTCCNHVIAACDASVRVLLASLMICYATAQHGLAAAGSGDSFAIRAAQVYPCTAEQGEPIANGVIIIRSGKVVAVGANLDVPADLRLVELRDATIVPGFVNAASSAAGFHAGEKAHGSAYRAVDAFDRYARNIADLSRGTTTIHMNPGGHRIITGQGAVVKLGGDPARRVLRESCDLAINLGVYDPPLDWKLNFYASADEAIQPANRQGPESRFGQLQEIDEAIAKAMRWRDRDKVRATRPVDFDIHAAALAEIWDGGVPLRFSVRRAADIDAAIDFLKRHKKAGYLVGMTEADKVRGLLDAGLPVVLRIEDSFTLPAPDLGRSPDVLEPACPIMHRVKARSIALAGAEGSSYEDLRMVAAIAMRGGMSHRAALEGITRIPAEIIGVADRVGSIAPGRDADLLVLSGPPLDINSSVLSVYVDGVKAFDAPRTDALVVRAGTIWVGNGQVLNDASILVQKGKVSQVGRRVSHPPFARIVNAGRDAFVAPGFIDAHGHLGLDGDRQAVSADVPLSAIIGTASKNFLRVARAGITTVMTAAYTVGNDGSRVAAIKTFGRSRDDLVVRDVTAMKFSLRGKDPLLSMEELRRVLKAGKEYEEKWKKYEEELKKWQEEQARGGTTERKSESGEVSVSEEKPDPISGTWSFSVSGGPLPEAVTGTMSLRLDGTKVEGRMTVMNDSDEVKVSGSFVANQLTLDIDQDTPLGRPRVTATLDTEDHLKGTVALGEFSIDFEAKRTDKSAPEFRVMRKRGRGKGGRPVPPKVDESLEPVRELLASKIPALVDVQTAPQILSLLKLFVEESKLSLVLLNAEESALAAEQLAKAKVGVVVPPAPLRERDRRPYNQAADLALRGVPVALQSDAEDGARNLGLMALFATQQGLGGDAALSALTIDAARMFKIDDRVGSLEAGKDADLLIFSGHPFDAGSRLERVFVAGEEVPNE